MVRGLRFLDSVKWQVSLTRRLEESRQLVLSRWGSSRYMHRVRVSEMAPFFSLKKDKIFLKKDFSLFLCWARILIMNTENTLKIGDVVKSLDFVGNNNCYYVGKVLSVDENSGTFTAEVWDRIWQGESIDRVFAKTFTAPLPGKHLLDDLEENIRDPRIQVVAYDPRIFH
jgi:hypothetical protein